MSGMITHNGPPVPSATADMPQSSVGYSGGGVLSNECAGCKRADLPLLVCDDCAPSSDGSQQR